MTTPPPTPPAKSACPTCGKKNQTYRAIGGFRCNKCRPNEEEPRPVSEEEMDRLLTMMNNYFSIHPEIAGNTWPPVLSYIRSLRASLSQKEEECRRLRSVLKGLPDKLRASLSGHKGEAYRIASQICDEALSPSSHD